MPSLASPITAACMAAVAVFAGGILFWTPPLDASQFSDAPLDWPADLQYYGIKAAPDLEVQCFSSGPRSERGRKATILFVHGFPESAASWKDYVVHFGEQGFHAVACDMRNVNNSVAASGTAFSLDQLADDLRGIADALDDSKIAVVGHDWGAAGAQAFAMKYPDSVKALVTIAVPHVELYRWYNTVRLPLALRNVWYFLVFGLTGPLARWKIAKDDFQWLVWFIFGSSAPGTFSKAKIEQLKDSWRPRMSDPVSSTVTTWYWMGCQWLLRGLLPPGMASGLSASMWSSYTPITAPALQLHGAEDIYVTADEMIEANPDQSTFFPHPRSKYIIYQGATHWVNHERKHDLIAEMSAFFEETLV